MTADLKCPNCSGDLRPAVLVCDPCGVRIEARFDPPNEFARLSRDDLHLLRIFVHTEGSIRDMESALGISYPTVKQRLAQLRERLRSSPVPAVPVPPRSGDASPVGVPGRTTEAEVGVILQDMKAGKLAPADAARLIRELRSAEGRRA